MVLHSGHKDVHDGRAESIIDLTLGRLVYLEILDHHEGDYWTLSSKAWQSKAFAGSQDDTAVQFVKARIANVIFNNEIPDPRDIIIISLINTCDVFRFIFVLDEESEERIELICKMDLIGRSIGEAVAGNLVGPMLRRPSLSKQIPVVPLRQILLNPHVRDGNMPALSADLAEQYGPVFRKNPWFFGRFRDKLLGASAWAQLPESAGLPTRFREGLRRIWNTARAGRSRPFPLPKGNEFCILKIEIGKPSGTALPSCPSVHVELDGGRLPSRGPHVSAIYQLADLGQRRFAGHHRRHHRIQGTSAQHSRFECITEVHAEYPGNETPEEKHRRTAGSSPERPHPCPARWLPAGSCG